MLPESPPVLTPGVAPRDRALVVLLLGMAALLVGPYARAFAPENEMEATLICSRQMLSYYLLPAMGLWLVLRCGQLDLSVWMTFALGALVAAKAAGHLPPLGALALGGVAGAAAGVLSASLSRIPRIPAWAATGVTALVAWAGMRWCFSGPVQAPDDAFASLLLSAASEDDPLRQTVPLFVTRSLAVATTYGVVMLALLNRQHTPLTSPRRSLAVALVASGALGGWGGALSLLDLGRAGLPSHPVGDLRVPAAALLAGAWYLQASHRRVLTGVLLPPAMLLVTAFLPAWDMARWGYHLQLLVLMGLTLLVQLGFHRWFADHSRRGALLAAVLGAVAVWGLCLGAYGSYATYRAAHWVATFCGVAGAALLTVSVTRRA
jgi:ribose/xylose/arabinose/galactoside ABC-type transport system permease subunit